ncbi:MAG: GNAT family N-acetyltransferase [Candidatus Acidiferrum sp.]
MEIGEQPDSSRPKQFFEVQIKESYSPEDRDALAGGEKDPSQTSAYQLEWRPTEKHVFVFEGGRPVCHVGFVRQTVEVQGNPVSVVGFGGVLTRHGCRGRGYCRIAIEAAEVFALNQLHVNFILLFCRPVLLSFYEHLGWTKLSSPTWAEQAQGTVLLPIVMMVKCLSVKKWPNGEVRLGSRPW